MDSPSINGPERHRSPIVKSKKRLLATEEEKDFTLGLESRKY
jgi:hypothetical protein